MSVREKVRSHDERNGGKTKMPRRVICKLVSTGLYCACPPADIVPLMGLITESWWITHVVSLNDSPAVCVMVSFTEWLMIWNLTHTQTKRGNQNLKSTKTKLPLEKQDWNQGSLKFENSCIYLGWLVVVHCVLIQRLRERKYLDKCACIYSRHSFNIFGVQYC